MQDCNSLCDCVITVFTLYEQIRVWDEHFCGHRKWWLKMNRPYIFGMHSPRLIITPII